MATLLGRKHLACGWTSVTLDRWYGPDRAPSRTAADGAAASCCWCRLLRPFPPRPRRRVRRVGRAGCSAWRGEADFIHCSAAKPRCPWREAASELARWTCPAAPRWRAAAIAGAVRAQPRRCACSATPWPGLRAAPSAHPIERYDPDTMGGVLRCRRGGSLPGAGRIARAEPSALLRRLPTCRAEGRTRGRRDPRSPRWRTSRRSPCVRPKMHPCCWRICPRARWAMAPLIAAAVPSALARPARSLLFMGYRSASPPTSMACRVPRQRLGSQLRRRFPALQLTVAREWRGVGRGGGA